MGKIAGKDTKPEILIRKWLFAKGFRYRKNDKRLPGTPDIVLPKYRTVIFIHGCFWHSHEGCKKSKLPETAKEFWAQKINQNQVRDRTSHENLEAVGWQVIVIWQCEISSRAKQKEKLEWLVERIKNS
jgi:DNA mismatch endonuclease (patch repair protein)